LTARARRCSELRYHTATARWLFTRDTSGAQQDLNVRRWEKKKDVGRRDYELFTDITSFTSTSSHQHLLEDFNVVGELRDGSDVTLKREEHPVRPPARAEPGRWVREGRDAAQRRKPAAASPANGEGSGVTKALLRKPHPPHGSSKRRKISRPEALSGNQRTRFSFPLRNSCCRWSQFPPARLPAVAPARDRVIFLLPSLFPYTPKGRKSCRSAPPRRTGEGLSDTLERLSPPPQLY